MIKLDNWAIVTRQAWDGTHKLKLKGSVYGHPRFEEGAEVTTTTVKYAVGTIVKTKSGSLYTLATPDPEFVKYINEVESALDWNNPFALYEDVERLVLDSFSVN